MWTEAHRLAQARKIHIWNVAFERNTFKIWVRLPSMPKDRVQVRNLVDGQFW